MSKKDESLQESWHARAAIQTNQALYKIGAIYIYHSIHFGPLTASCTDFSNLINFWHNTPVLFFKLYPCSRKEYTRLEINL